MTFNQNQLQRKVPLFLSFSFKGIKGLCHLGYFTWRQNTDPWVTRLLSCAQRLTVRRAAALDYLCISSLPFFTSLSSLNNSYSVFKTQTDRHF